MMFGEEVGGREARQAAAYNYNIIMVAIRFDCERA